MVTGGVSLQDVWKALGDVKDPEIPVLSVVDLKIVRSVSVIGTKVSVELTPTFLGCPALDTIVELVRTRLHSMGFQEIVVQKTFVGSWSTDLLEEDTRRRLGEYGIAPPVRTDDLPRDSAIPCPFCRSTETRAEGPFGATLCKQLYYCNTCRQSFEKFKTI